MLSLERIVDTTLLMELWEMLLDSEEVITPDILSSRA
jgi:hypothetical protein